MKMDEKTIKEALLRGERVTLECKRAKDEVPKSVWASRCGVSSFLFQPFSSLNGFGRSNWIFGETMRKN